MQLDSVVVSLFVRLNNSRALGLDVHNKIDMKSLCRHETCQRKAISFAGRDIKSLSGS